MDGSVLKKIGEYMDIYEKVAAGIKSVEELKTELRKIGVSAGPLARRNEYLLGEPAYLKIEGDDILYNWLSLDDDLDDLRKTLIPSARHRDEKMKAEIEELRKQNEELKAENQKSTEKIEHQEEHITNLMAKIDEMKASALRAEMGRKVLVSSSIKVGPKKDSIDDVFLMEPETLLDVDKCVARYGGELDSFYEETPSDKKEDKSFEPGHELTQDNYFLRLMKTVATKGFFKKRVRDNQEVKEIESKVGQLFPGHYDYQTERQKERDRILKNRYISVNKLMQLDRITNQEKLMMYAMVSPYHGTNIERLLNYAGQYCINADYLIALLEDPDICTTYENTIDFLNQFASPSEFKMKYDFAQELIEGKWYITAEYNGRQTKFQLVPIDEFNELRKAAGLPVSEFCYKGKEQEEIDESKKKKEPIIKIERSEIKPEDIPASTESATDLSDDGSIA